MISKETLEFVLSEIKHNYTDLMFQWMNEKDDNIKEKFNNKLIKLDSAINELEEELKGNTNES